MLKKAMDVFAEKTGKSAGSLRFFFDGTRVQNDSTPESVSYLLSVSCFIH